MAHTYPVTALIFFSLLAASLTFKWTCSAICALAVMLLYPCIGAFVVRFCEWLRFQAANQPDFFAPAHGAEMEDWTQVQRVLFGSVWPATLLVSGIYYGFLIIVKYLY